MEQPYPIQHLVRLLLRELNAASIRTTHSSIQNPISQTPCYSDKSSTRFFRSMPI
jgi:hypothetical protein